MGIFKAYDIRGIYGQDLTEDDVAGLSGSELRIARNEIYARHGCLFRDSSLQNYFDHQAWYTRGNTYASNYSLSKLESDNVNFIKRHE